MSPETSLDQLRRDFAAQQFNQVLRASHAWLRSVAAAAPERDTQVDVLRMRALSAQRMGELALARKACRQALRLLGEDRTHPLRLEVLVVLVNVAGQLVRLDESINALRELLPITSRSERLADYVRGRSTTANFFAYLGDPWAARHIFDEVIVALDKLPEQRRLKAVALNNVVAACVHQARMAELGGDQGDTAKALASARSYIETMRVAVAEVGDGSLAAVAGLNTAEVALMAGETTVARSVLLPAAEQARAREWHANAWRLDVMLAEAALHDGDAALARQHLLSVGPLGAGHEVELRILWHGLMHRAHAGPDPAAERLAHQHLRDTQALVGMRLYRQQRAQSRYLRTRLELDYLYPPLPIALHAGGAGL